jgi:hypothetical protein
MSAMEVWLKTESEAQSDAKSTADGLETWYPLAPGLGRKSVRISFYPSIFIEG